MVVCASCGYKIGVNYAYALVYWLLPGHILLNIRSNINCCLSSPVKPVNICELPDQCQLASYLYIKSGISYNIKGKIIYRVALGLEARSPLSSCCHTMSLLSASCCGDCVANIIPSLWQYSTALCCVSNVMRHGLGCKYFLTDMPPPQHSAVDIRHAEEGDGYWHIS